MAARVRASVSGVRGSPAGLAAARVDELSNVDLASGGWRRHFESLRGRRATIFAHIFINHVYYPLKNHYLSKYGPIEQARGGSLSPGPSSRARSATCERDAIEPVEPVEPVEPWHWRTFPKMWRALVWYRIVNTAYMIYVVVKNVYPPLLEEPLRRLLNPSKPINCYLLGRYLPNTDVRRAFASLFACYNIFWRYFQVYQPVANYMVSTIYFLLLDDRDIVNYYKLLDRARRRQHATAPAMGKCKPLSGAHQVLDEPNDTFFHDIMSARVDRCNRVTFKLRPNRTAESSRLLRKHLVDASLIWAAVFVLLATTITYFMSVAIFNTERYLEDYPGCSPDLQLLYNEGQPSGWHLHLRWHQLMASMVDYFENFILWTECGLVGASSIPFTMVLNYDLILYWKYLDNKLTIFSREARESYIRLDEINHYESSHGASSHEFQDSKHVRLMKFDKFGARDNQIYELQMEWQDFIKQIKHSDAFLGEALTCFIMVWYTLFGVLIYDTTSAGKNTLPLAANLTLFWIIVVVTCNCAALLAPHRHCLKSYTKLCSLVAYDRSAHRRNFIQIMDYFTSKRTCFTLCRRQKMTATTYLTIVGWSFSCFFIIVNVRKS